jgi:hypothetical protein
MLQHIQEVLLYVPLPPRPAHTESGECGMKSTICLGGRDVPVLPATHLLSLFLTAPSGP